MLEVDTAKGTWLAPARPGLRHQHRQALHGRLLTNQPANQKTYVMPYGASKVLEFDTAKGASRLLGQDCGTGTH